MTPNTIDYSKPLSLDEEKSVLKNRKETHTLYCVGDIVQTKGNCGKVIPVKLTKIRNNGLSYTDDVQHARISISDTRVMIDRLISLLKSIDNITTLPALQVMFGVVLMELDYLYVRLSADSDLIDSGVIFALGNGDSSYNYGQYVEKLKPALQQWNRRSIDNKDDACYFNPGFEYDLFEKKFDEFVDVLREKGNAVMNLLNEMNASIQRPTMEKLRKMYDLLHRVYLHGAYSHDIEEYETFHIGVTRFNTIKLLTDRLAEMEKELDESKVFEKFGYDLQLVICKLYNPSKNKWDEDALAKHIFAHRKELTQKQLNVFFKYVEIGGKIKQELEEFKKTPDAVMVKLPTNSVNATHQVGQSTPVTAQELNELLRQLAASGMPMINLTVVNGENRIIQPENYGDNIIMGANSKIERIQSNEHGEPQQ